MTDPADTELAAKLNRETAQIAWQQLQDYHQQESVIYVSAELDLIQVAMQLANDNHQQLKSWLDNQLVSKVTAVQDQQWQHDNAQLWAVVVAPWVLVQEPKD